MLNPFLTEPILAFRVLPTTRGDLIRAMNAAGYPKRGFGSGDYIACNLPRADVKPLPTDRLRAALAAMDCGDTEALDNLLLDSKGR